MPPAASVPALHDNDLALEIERAASGSGNVLVVANEFTVLVLEQPDASAPWTRTASGEFGSKAQAATRRLRGRLYWASIDGDPLTADIAALDLKTHPANFALALCVPPYATKSRVSCNSRRHRKVRRCAPAVPTTADEGRVSHRPDACWRG